MGDAGYGWVEVRDYTGLLICGGYLPPRLLEAIVQLMTSKPEEEEKQVSELRFGWHSDIYAVTLIGHEAKNGGNAYFFPTLESAQKYALDQCTKGREFIIYKLEPRVRVEYSEPTVRLL